MIRPTIDCYYCIDPRAVVRLSYGPVAGEGYILAGFSSLVPPLFSPWLLYWLGMSSSGTQASSSITQSELSSFSVVIQNFDCNQIRIVYSLTYVT